MLVILGDPRTPDVLEFVQAFQSSGETSGLLRNTTKGTLMEHCPRRIRGLFNSNHLISYPDRRIGGSTRICRMLPEPCTTMSANSFTCSQIVYPQSVGSRQRSYGRRSGLPQMHHRKRRGRGPPPGKATWRDFAPIKQGGPPSTRSIKPSSINCIILWKVTGTVKSQSGSCTRSTEMHSKAKQCC